MSKIPEDLGISASCLRGWMAQADIDDGQRPGLSTGERVELVKLCKANRALEMEVKIVQRAAAFFARENFRPT